MRSGSELGQADSPIGWVRNTPQQPPSTLSGSSLALGQFTAMTHS
jgi:hypothetical protein